MRGAALRQAVQRALSPFACAHAADWPPAKMARLLAGIDPCPLCTAEWQHGRIEELDAMCERYRLAAGKTEIELRRLARANAVLQQFAISACDTPEKAAALADDYRQACNSGALENGNAHA